MPVLKIGSYMFLRLAYRALGVNKSVLGRILPFMTDICVDVTGKCLDMTDKYIHVTDKCLDMIDKYHHVTDKCPSMTDKYLDMIDKYLQVTDKCPVMTDIGASIDGFLH